MRACPDCLTYASNEFGAPGRLAEKPSQVAPGVADGSSWLPVPPRTSVGPVTVAHAIEAVESAANSATPMPTCQRLMFMPPPQEPKVAHATNVRGQSSTGTPGTSQHGPPGTDTRVPRSDDQLKATWRWPEWVAFDSSCSERRWPRRWCRSSLSLAPEAAARGSRRPPRRPR